MARPSDWSPLDLDEDPTPGNAGDIQHLGSTYTTFANNVADVHKRLTGMEKSGPIAGWKGLSGDAFRKQLGDLPGQLDKLHESYKMAGKALTDFGNAVEAAQKKADNALTSAQPLYKELQQKKAALPGLQHSASSAKDANDKIKNPDHGAPKPDPQKVREAARNATNASNAATDCSNRIAHLESQLKDLRKHATDAHSERHTAAGNCADALGKASDAGIHNKHWWQKAWDFVAHNWHWVITALKIIVAIGGIILLFVPGLNILALIVLAAALIVFADTLVKAIQGKASWGDVALAALDCIPVLGKVGALAKLGSAIEKGEGAMKGLNAAMKFAKGTKAMQAFKGAENIKGLSGALGRSAKWVKGLDDIKGFKGALAVGGRDFAKNTAISVAGDFLPGGKGLNQVPKDLFNNAVGSVGGSVLGHGVSRGLDNMALNSTLRSAEHGGTVNWNPMSHFGNGTAGNNLITGGVKGLTTSVVKEVGNDTIFGGDFSWGGAANNVGTGALSGAGAGAMGKDYDGKYHVPTKWD